MSRANHPTIRTYAEADRYLGGKYSRPIPSIRYTSVQRRDGGDLALVYHQTDVVTYHPDGSYTLKHDGYETVLTKRRINEFSPFRIIQKNSVWYLNGEKFAHGITLWPDGQVPVMPTTIDEFLAQTLTELKATLFRLGACSPARSWLATLPEGLTASEIVDRVEEPDWLHWLTNKLYDKALITHKINDAYLDAFLTSQHDVMRDNLALAKSAFKSVILGLKESANA